MMRDNNILHNGTLPVATIANGETESSKIDIADFSGGSFQVPATLTQTTLTLQVSIDGTVWDTIRDPIDRSELANWAVRTAG